jgi:hypothetical protein
MEKLINLVNQKQNIIESLLSQKENIQPNSSNALSDQDKYKLNNSEAISRENAVLRGLLNDAANDIRRLTAEKDAVMDASNRLRSIIKNQSNKATTDNFSQTVPVSTTRDGKYFQLSFFFSILKKTHTVSPVKRPARPTSPMKFVPFRFTSEPTKQTPSRQSTDQSQVSKKLAVESTITTTKIPKPKTAPVTSTGKPFSKLPQAQVNESPESKFMQEERARRAKGIRNWNIQEDNI